MITRTKEAIEEFKKIWQEEHPNQEITKEQLLEMAQRILNAVELVYRPVPKEKIERFRELKVDNYD